MKQNRYYKSDEQLAKLENAGEDLVSDIEGVIIDYLTDPELAAAVVPKPLKASVNGKMRVAINRINMHIAEGVDVDMGAAVFGVHVEYEGTPGIYYITMPMETEMAVLIGRETYGEPKKIADVSLKKDGDSITAAVTRHGINFIEFKGVIDAEVKPENIIDNAFCYKCLPGIEGKGFDVDPILTKLKIERRQETANKVQGELVLNESPFDPVVDLPILGIESIIYETGKSLSGGEVIKSVPGEWLKNVAHQRIDDLSSLFG